MPLFAKKLLLPCLIVFAGLTGIAKAGIYTGTYAVTATEGLTYGYGFNALSANPFASYAAGTTATATYTYSGALNFANTNASSADTNSAFGYTTANISNYSGSGTITYSGTQVANYGSVSSYIASTASVSNFGYGTYYTIDLGVIAAGTVLTITHDDGASIYQNGSMVGLSVYGPTSQVTDTIELTSTSDTILYYTRQNGAPSVLQVTVPEPSSIALLITGLTGVAVISRRRPKKASQ